MKLFITVYWIHQFQLHLSILILFSFVKALIFPRCHKALAPKGINLTKIITEPDPKIYDNILNSFIGIAAVQIGLTDILKAVGIEPDYIIGK